VNSPLATTVTGQVKDILSTGLAMVLFHDVPHNIANISGIVAGLVGSIAYSMLSLYQR
jgi:drug/metabolite transporter (DMT)-like permease